LELALSPELVASEELISELNANSKI